MVTQQNLRAISSLQQRQNALTRARQQVQVNQPSTEQLQKKYEQDIEKIKQENAKKSIEEIDKRLAEEQAKFEAANYSYEHATSFESGESADRRRTELTTRIEALKQAKGYAATGEYDVESVISYSMQRGYGQLNAQSDIQNIRKQQEQLSQERLSQINVAGVGESGTEKRTYYIPPEEATRIQNLLKGETNRQRIEAILSPYERQTTGVISVQTPQPTYTQPTIVKPTTTKSWGVLKEAQFQAERGFKFITGQPLPTPEDPYQRNIALGRVREVPQGYKEVVTTSGTDYYSPEGKKYTYKDFPRVSQYEGGVPSTFQPTNILTSQPAVKGYEQQTIESERARYSNLGYSSYEANILAKESVARGGVTFKKETRKDWKGREYTYTPQISEYQKKHIVGTILSIFGGEGETGEEQAIRLAEQKYIEETPYNVLLVESPSRAVRKLAGEAGKGYFSVTSDIFALATEKPQLSEERKQQGGKVFGEFFLWAGFAPMMKTGSYGEAFEVISPKKKPSQVLSENKFGELGEGLAEETKISAVASIEREVASKSTLKEQLEVLKGIKNRLTTKEAIENFDKFSKTLVDKGIIKPIIVEVNKKGVAEVVSNIPTKPELIYMIEKTPEMKAVGSIIGFTTGDYTSTFVKAEKQKAVSYNILGIEETTKTKEKQKVIPILNIKQIQVPRLKQPELMKQPEPQVPVLKQPQPQIPKMKQPEVSIFKQPPKLKPRLKIKEKPKFPKPFFFKLGLEKPTKTKSMLSMKKGDEFEIFGKKKGKFSLIGTTKSEKEAEKEMKQYLFSGLQASAYIQKKGTKEKIPAKKFIDTKFRVSKKSPFIVVQQEKGKGGRLTTGMERKEIKQARKQKVRVKQIKWFG